MPTVQHYPRYGMQRPGTNHYVYGGWAYGAYQGGGFGEGATTPTNVAVATNTSLASAFSSEAAGQLAAGIAALAAGKPAEGKIRIEAANTLQKQAMNPTPALQATPAPAAGGGTALIGWLALAAIAVVALKR